MPTSPSGIAVIIPAFNERGCIGETLASVLAQCLPPDQVIVVDDGSDDGTGDYVAEAFPSVLVLRAAAKLGSKAEAQNYALFYQSEPGVYLIDAPMVVTIDADTTLEPDSLAELAGPIQEGLGIRAVCGAVIPRNLDNPYTWGRLGEYLYSFYFPKRVQQAWGGQIQIVSGCFGCYETETLRARGGWLTTTMAEDMDLTADYHESKHKVAFNIRAVCHPIEPYNWQTYRAQMERWSAAFFQNLALHWRTYARRWVGLFVLASFLDALLGGIIYPLAPFWMLLFGWRRWLLWFLLGDFILVSIPILLMGRRVNLLRQAIKSIPYVFFLRLLNTWFWFRALVREWFLHKHLRTYTKGH